MARPPARLDPRTITPEIVTAKITEADVVRVGAQLVRAYAQVEETQTEILRRLALVVVKLRSYYRTGDGAVDWAGRSWDYRQTVERMYSEAGVPPDSAANVQAALRYHVGNALRELVEPEELASAGLLPTSPRQRLQAAREEAQAVLEMVSREQDLPPTRTRALVVLRAASRALDALQEDVERLADEEERAAVWAALGELADRLAQLQAQLGPSTGGSRRRRR